MLSNTSTPWAPWYVIPADHKWFARIAAAAVIVNTLIEIDPRFPTMGAEGQQQLAEARKMLESDAAAEVRPDGNGSRRAARDHAGPR